MRGRFLAAWGLLTAAIAAVVGFFAYNAGLSTHVATTAGDGRVFYPYYGFGFGFFPLFGLFWIFLIGFFVFRLLFWRPWRGGWGYGPRGYWHQHPIDQGPSQPTTGVPSQPSSGGQPQEPASA